ncbi:MAG TPA: tripartite tricarboxylate transporter TctB family protein [Rectinemataceae bacterium]|nr:tripartite tricarboxylate transporter TctB family protein [Rectinemataceae bacterium]
MSTEIMKEEEATPSLPPELTDEIIARKPRREVIGALGLLAVAILFGVESFKTPFKDTLWEFYTSPTIFPLFMAILLGATSISVLVRGIREWHNQKDSIEPIHPIEDMKRWGMGRFLGGAGIIVVFLFFLGKINFYLLSVVMINIFGLAFRLGTLRKAIKSSLITSAVVAIFLFIISRVFGIVFPGA